MHHRQLLHNGLGVAAVFGLPFPGLWMNLGMTNSGEEKSEWLSTSFPNKLFCNVYHSLTFWLEKEMATHSSVLAWRIPGTGEPGRLPSKGLHRVGHDWSDLAVAARSDTPKSGWKYWESHKSRDPRVSCLNPRKTSRDLLQHVLRPDSPTMTWE